MKGFAESGLALDTVRVEGSLGAEKTGGAPIDLGPSTGPAPALARCRGRGALSVILLISIGLGIVGAYRWALATPYFRLREVALEGLQHLSQSVLLGRLALPEGANLLALDLGGLRQRLEGHPWVRSAVLHRELPGRLRVEIRERHPAAVLEEGGLLLDSEGTVLGRAGEGSERYPVLLALPTKGKGLGNLPERVQPLEIEGLSVGMEVLRLFEAFRPMGVRVLRVDLREGGTLTVDVEGREGQTTRLRLGREDLRQGLRRFGALLFLWEKGPWPKDVDLSMGPRAVVR